MTPSQTYRVKASIWLAVCGLTAVAMAILIILNGSYS